MYTESVKSANNMNLSELLKERMLENYKTAIADMYGSHFSEHKEFTDFIDDGIAILDWIKKNRGKYFNVRNTKLVGIEIPLTSLISEDYPNIFMIGAIDLVLYDNITETYTIYDIKTSTRGWKDNEKKDKIKINQILLYKYYYSKLMNIPQDKINVVFFIVKRKPYSIPDVPVKRVQEVIPANKSKKVNLAVIDFRSFIESCYDKSGALIERAYSKNITNCKYCPFADKPDLCNRLTEE
jgi:hypothetical protein